jgi:signal transduction histidine kinase
MLKLPKIKSILYVEDEKSIQEELAEVLETFCETLYLADDGFQGLEQYQKYMPDIIVTDVKMPVMDGIEMSTKIKELDGEAHIVFTTAFSDMEFFQAAIELQVDGYILKPISLDALENKLLNIIGGIHLKEELFEKEQMLLQTSKLAAMGEMIGNIAHQWKQPLSTISMSVNNARADMALNNLDPDLMTQYADTIETQLRYLTNTIDDFRSFFKPNIVNETYNVKDFLEKCISLVKASFDENTIETIKEIDDKINSYGDANQLTQAIINILNNAKDALKSSEKLRKKLIFIMTVKEDDNNNIIIVIKDNGGGIPENIIGRIFEPYFTTKEDTGGTGLGLYITHTIITKNLKGKIFAQNEIFTYEGVEYKGAKFTITLPKI